MEVFWYIPDPLNIKNPPGSGLLARITEEFFFFLTRFMKFRTQFHRCQVDRTGKTIQSCHRIPYRQKPAVMNERVLKQQGITEQTWLACRPPFTPKSNLAGIRDIGMVKLKNFSSVPRMRSPRRMFCNSLRGDNCRPPAVKLLYSAFLTKPAAVLRERVG